MEIRGFKHTRGEWVPKKGQIGITAITPDGPVEVIVKGSKKGTKIRAGSIMKECGGLARECIRKGNTLKVRVTNDVPENTKKGYVIRCTYMFRGPATPDLINLAKESEKCKFYIVCSVSFKILIFTNIILYSLCNEKKWICVFQCCVTMVINLMNWKYRFKHWS